LKSHCSVKIPYPHLLCIWTFKVDSHEQRLLVKSPSTAPCDRIRTCPGHLGQFKSGRIISVCLAQTWEGVLFVYHSCHPRWPSQVYNYRFNYLLDMAILGDARQIEMILSDSHRPRCPRQLRIMSNVAMAGSFIKIFANVNET
jgi:hypothetical protein